MYAHILLRVDHYGWDISSPLCHTGVQSSGGKPPLAAPVSTRNGKRTGVAA